MTNREISHDPHHSIAPKPRIDWTKPVLWLFAAVLIALIGCCDVMARVYAFTDRTRHPTLQNFVTCSPIRISSIRC